MRSEILKKVYYKLRQMTGLNRVSHWVSGSRMCPFILCYHQVETEEFREHIRFLKKRFPIVTLAELEVAIKGGNFIPISALTLDDCIQEDVEKAMKVANEEKVPITFYLPTAYCKANISMWANKVKEILRIKDIAEFNGVKYSIQTKNKKNELKDKIIAFLFANKLQTDEMEEWVNNWLNTNGVDEASIPASLRVISPEFVEKATQASPWVRFDSHTSTHPQLSLCSEDEIESEMAESKNYIKEITGCESTSLCYPYGSSEIIGNIAPTLAQKHYSNATSFVYGICKPGTDIYFLPRIGIYPGEGNCELAGKIYHYQNLYLLGK